MRLFIVTTLVLIWSTGNAWSGGKGKNFKGEDISRRKYDEEFLEGANFEGCTAFLTTFRDCRLKGANFKYADLTSATLDGSDLTGADFRGAILTRIGIQKTNLTRANFEGLDLKQISFQNCKLKGANLKKTKGWGDIRHANFEGANLRGANLRGAQDPEKTARFEGAEYDNMTTWPVGFDVEGSGARLVGGKVAERRPINRFGDWTYRFIQNN